YDPAQLDVRDIIEMMDAAVGGAENPRQLNERDLHLPLCASSMSIAAVAQFAVPALLPYAAALFAYTSIPTFRRAFGVLFRERRLGSDVLDAAVVIGCIGTMSIFPGTVLGWCVGVGRVLTERTQVNARKLLLDSFGKQPQHARLCTDGGEARVRIDRL